LEITRTVMASTHGNGSRFLVYSCYELRVRESILFLRSNYNTTRVESIRGVTGSSGVPFELVSTRCCKVRIGLGSAGSTLDIYLIIESTYQSLISRDQ